MALNRIFKENELDNRARVVPSGTVSGDPLFINDRPAVALTDRGDATRTVTDAGTGVSVTLPSGGVGLADDEASLAFNGTFEFDVVSTGSTPAPTSTPQDTVVYITGGGDLTLTEATNDRYGTVDYPKDYHRAAGRLPVRVGG